MAKKSKGLELDLNNDGKFDKEDKKIAGKVLASKISDKKVVKEEEIKTEEVKEEFIAVVDISRKYRKGSVVTKEQIEIWKESGINYEQWF